MFSSTRTGFLSSYYPLWIFGQLMGVSAVILVGTLYHKGVLSTDGYNWKTSPFSFHPLMMIIGLLFCYGNAILSYRTVTRVPKMTVKLIHGSLLVLSLVFALVGFIAVIRAKNESVPPNSHFMSLHAWMGLITLILFVLQWIFGFISFLIPKLSLEARQQYLPM
jgi:cytochrome b-561